MANVYFNPNNTAVGDGSIGNPYKSLASHTSTAGDVLYLESGTTFYEGFAESNVAVDNITITTTGSEPATLDGSIPVTAWVQSSVPGIWQYAIGANNGGNVTENGSPMSGTTWSTDIATTAPSIAIGGFANDYNTGTIYIRPSMGDPTRSVYRVSVIQHCLQSTSNHTGLSFNNLIVRQFSRHGFQLLNKANVHVTNCEFHVIGGHASGGTYVGNGVEYGPNCQNGTIKNNKFYDTFDSPISTQLYTNSTFVRNIDISYNTIVGFGLFGIEVTIVGAVTNCSQTNIMVHHNTISEGGYSWRQFTATARALHTGGTQATSTWNNIIFSENTCINNYWGLSVNTGGSTSNGVVFARNWVITTKSPANGRGCYSNNTVVFRSNIIIGYSYGLVVFGTAVINYYFYNNTFYNVGEAVVWDGSGVAPTLVLRNNLFWTTGGRFYRVLISATLLFDMNYNAIRAGITIGGPTLGANDIRPSSLSFNANFYPETSSTNLIGAGTNVGSFKDMSGRLFKSTPSIGAMEYYS